MNNYNEHLQNVKKLLCDIVDQLDEYPATATKTEYKNLITDIANEIARAIDYDGSPESIKRAL